MKRLIAATLISGCVASSAVAGGLSTTVVEPGPTMVEPNSSSGGWIPIAIAIALIAVAASASE